MGRRINPISLRIKTTLNYPSDCRNAFINNFLKHVFQDYLISKPGIRSNLSKSWINLTIFDPIGNLEKHALFQSKVLDFNNINIKNTKNKNLIRIDNLKSNHFYYSKVFNSIEGKSDSQVKSNSLDSSKSKSIDNSSSTSTSTSNSSSKLLAIYPLKSNSKDPTLIINFNIIKNPLLNGDILAEFIARELKIFKPIQRIFNDLLKSMK
jgi:hypothetical protein